MTEAAVRRVGVIGVGRMGLPMARHTAAAGFQVKVFDIDPAACRKAELAVYYAYIDRAPVFIIGATGPMDETKRRPHIDWAHTANVQGEAVRHYTKWDYQPAVIGGVPESFERAYSVMMTEPQGPIYMCYDAWLQEQPLTEEVPLAPAEAVKVPALMAPDPTALAAVAERLLAAERPVLLADYVGRQHRGFHDLVALAETLGRRSSTSTTGSTSRAATRST